MTSSTRVLRDLYRICGEAQFLILHDGKRVLNGYFISLAPVRGFEKLVVGKNPVFVIEAVMRICGVCHAAHGINAAEAIENALGIFPPPNGLILREIVGLLNRIQSHILHLVLFIPDFVREGLRSDCIKRSVELLNISSNLLTKFGGAPTHPPNIVIGGMSSMPKQRDVDQASKMLNQFKQKFMELMDLLENENNLSDCARALAEIEFKPKFLASHLFYGDQTNINISKIRTLFVDEYRSNVLDEARKSTSLIALYGDTPVEVGPRARLSLFWNFKDYSILGVQRARLQEISLGLERIEALIDELDPTEPTRTTAVIFRRGRGVSVFEAPRGLLIHFAEISSDGRVSSYKIVVPTMFNIPIMETAVKNVPIEYVESVPRIYDPCIPCTTHLIEVK